MGYDNSSLPLTTLAFMCNNPLDGDNEVEEALHYGISMVLGKSNLHGGYQRRGCKAGSSPYRSLHL